MPTPYEQLFHSAAAPATALTGAIDGAAASFTVTDGTGFPTGKHYVLIDPTEDLDNNNSVVELVQVTRSGNTFTVVTGGRGCAETNAASHGSGAKVIHVFSATEAHEANDAARYTVGLVTAAGDTLQGSGAGTLQKTAIGASGRVWVSNGTIGAWVAVSGDATLASSGVLSLAAGSVGSSEIASDAVGTSELADDAVEQANIADDAVGLSELIASAKPRWAIPGFVHETNNGESNLLRPNFEGASTVGPLYAVAAEAGAIIGISVAIQSARTAGSLVFEVTKNGTGTGLMVTIDDDPVQYASATQAESADTFVAGDRIGVKMTGSSFTPLGKTLEVIVWCQAV